MELGGVVEPFSSSSCNPLDSAVEAEAARRSAFGDGVGAGMVGSGLSTSEGEAYSEELRD